MENTITLPRLATVQQFAEWMLVDKKTVYSWIYRGDVKSKKIGHTVRVILEDEKTLMGASK